ncbi:MAG: DUF3034 family protein [Rubrivivax sp.]
MPARLLIAALLLPLQPAAHAADGKLLLTGGVGSIDGAAGGGLSPWALIGTQATEGETGVSAHLTGVRSADYSLQVGAVALAWNDRIEASLAHQDFNARDNLAPLGLPGLHLRQTIVGLKLRLSGDAILDSDCWLPQVSVGLLHKRSDSGGLEPTLIGPLGADRRGTDFYIAATKLLLKEAVLVNLTLRATDANQGGLLGFGGAQGRGRRLMPEFSVAWVAARDIAIGAEVRVKPDNLDRSVLGDAALKEDDWVDLFIVWAPSKHLSLTLAAVDLGRIAPAVQPRRQRGGYLSAQVAY